MESMDTDVLVIGAGAAGIRSALAASEAHVDVLMIDSGEVTRSGATFSPLTNGWGIQALSGNERTDRNLERFYNEIIHVGLGTCDPTLAQILVEESGPRFSDLLSYGIRFRKTGGGEYLRSKGCFSLVERAYLTEDMANIQNSFKSILRRSHVKIIAGYVFDLILFDGICWGAWLIAPHHRFVRIHAKSTILCTGGGAAAFQNHLVDDKQVGDGYALAYRAGAELGNLEFIQFMLGLKTDSTRTFFPLHRLTEIDHLQNSKGDHILEEGIPDRDLRKKAIDERQAHVPFSCRDSSHHIDLLVAGAMNAGLELLWNESTSEENPAEVVHFSHAFNGGIKIDEKAESTVPGLFAAGEVAAGPHGADRIGGCMMTATQVFGERAGRFAALRAKGISTVPLDSRRPEKWGSRLKGERTKTQRKEADSLMVDTKRRISEGLGVLRNKEGLKNCLNGLEEIRSALEENERISARDYFRLNAALTTGELIARSALARHQSLGPHYRSDFPPSSPFF